jgi:type I restriction enzyme S subunit
MRPDATWLSWGRSLQRNEYRAVLLGEIATVNPVTPASFPDGELCSFVPMEAVDESTASITRAALRPYSEVARGYTRFAEDDVIVAKITPSMENGKCALARNLRNGVGFGSTEFHVLRASRCVLPEWLLYYWRLPKTRIRAEGNMTGTAGQKRVPQNFLELLEIPLPSPSQQARLANQLQTADRVRRIRHFTLELSEAFLSAAFVRMFGKEEANFPTLSVEELAEDRPDAIRTGPFGSQLLHSEFTDHGVAVLGIDNVVNNRFEWAKRRFITIEKFEGLKRYTVRPGDVLITIMGTCGRCAVVPDEIESAINTKHLCCISVDRERCMPVFLQGAFLYHPFVRRQLEVATNGAIMDGLNMEIVKALRIPLPPCSGQRRYVSIVKEHQRLLARQQEARRQTDHLFQSLLDRAFHTGSHLAGLRGQTSSPCRSP